CVRDLTSW
nr:immunoglobulin heavy chain junction region [Macaca mulatta]